MTGPKLTEGQDIKREIFARVSQCRREDLKGREEALREHNERMRKIRRELAADCEAAGGHEWVELPDNGFNVPHFLTGEWPMRCRWCEWRKPSTPDVTIDEVWRLIDAERASGDEE